MFKQMAAVQLLFFSLSRLDEKGKHRLDTLTRKEKLWIIKWYEMEMGVSCSMCKFIVDCLSWSNHYFELS